MGRTRLDDPPEKLVYQFLVILTGTDPLVWRRIQVPAKSSFWDLHVAIQDAMGWEDYHLHEFQLARPAELRGPRIEFVGIPDDESYGDRRCRPSWEVWTSDYFDGKSVPALYTYDFGDDWTHVVAFEGALSVSSWDSYPRCIGGARRCPPEDCGGVGGYHDFLEAIADPKHEDHDQLLAWVGGSYDPDDFDPAKVVFDDPRRRLLMAFGK